MTFFSGQFKCDPPLTPAHVAYLERFRGSRRMKRDSILVETHLEDPLRLAVDLPAGTEGEYFVGDGNDFGQHKDVSVVDFNSPPGNQPSLWCQWIPTGDGTAIEWDGDEKFYSYVEWLEYIINNFIVPWGYVLNGEVSWSGEETDDCGVIYCKDNKVNAVEKISLRQEMLLSIKTQANCIAYALNFLAMNLDDNDVESLTGVKPTSINFTGATLGT